MEDGVDRREVLTAVGIAAAGAAGFYGGTETASADPSGTFPQSSDDPLAKIRANQIELIPRSDDPSDPNNGVMWYNDSV